MASEYDNLIDGSLEKRRLPQFAKGSGESVAVSQVFVGKKSHERMYMSIEKQSETRWNIYRYTYSLRSDKETDISSEYQDWHSSFVDCADALAAFETQAKKEGRKPVEHLSGNFRDILCQHGAYFNDKGILVIGNSNALKENLSVKRSGASALFSKYAGDARDIKNWEDFYTKIVNILPQDEMLVSDNFRRGPDLAKLQEVVGSALTLMGVMDGQITDVDQQQLKKAKNVFTDNTAIYRLADSLSDTDEDSDGGTPRGVVYDYEVARLVTLLRFAGKVTLEAFSGFEVSTESLDLLEKTRATIIALAADKLGCTEKQAEQIAALSGQGLDPYIGTPLPLARYMSITPLPPEPPQKPKPPSPSP